MTVRFTVHTQSQDAARGWVRVVVHDTPGELRAAAAAYSKRTGDHTDHTDTAACFQGRGFEVHVDTDGYVDRPADGCAGVLRLTPDQGVATVAHECTHAALALFYRQYAPGLAMDQPMCDEEVLCYTVGDLVGTVTRGLQSHGVWPVPDSA